jgi:hypothetical protein
MFLVFPGPTLSNQAGNSKNTARTFDHSSISISPAVVSITTRPFVGSAIAADEEGQLKL